MSLSVRVFCSVAGLVGDVSHVCGESLHTLSASVGFEVVNSSYLLTLFHISGERLLTCSQQALPPHGLLS